MALVDAPYPVQLQVIRPETYAERVAGYRDIVMSQAPGLLFDLSVDSSKLVTMVGVKQWLRLAFIDNDGLVLATRMVGPDSGVYAGPPAARWLLETPVGGRMWLSAGNRVLISAP